MFSLPCCYKCGANADLVLDDGSSAVCYDCDDAFQAAMAAQYPLGQCGQCGADYRQVTCSLGNTHTYAFHAEGACGLWTDSGDADDGECGYGCRPAAAPRVALPFDLDDLPF